MMPCYDGTEPALILDSFLTSDRSRVHPFCSHRTGLGPPLSQMTSCFNPVRHPCIAILLRSTNIYWRLVTHIQIAPKQQASKYLPFSDIYFMTELHEPSPEERDASREGACERSMTTAKMKEGQKMAKM